jgi:hypothetical protein
VRVLGIRVGWMIGRYDHDTTYHLRRLVVFSYLCMVSVIFNFLKIFVMVIMTSTTIKWITILIFLIFLPHFFLSFFF